MEEKETRTSFRPSTRAQRYFEAVGPHGTLSGIWRDWDDMEFEPDILLPAQFLNGRGQPRTPERDLLLAFLRTSVHDLNGHANAEDRASALEWVASTDRKWEFSFENVCEQLGMVPEAIRDGLLKRNGKRPAN